MKDKTISLKTYNNLLDRIANILVEARTKVVREINKTQGLAYWEIGREIVEFEQKGKSRGEYGEYLIERLSKDMAPKFGKGVSPTNLKMMRLFYQTFPIRQTPSDKFEPMLSWSHYCELLKVEQHLGRSFYGLTEDPYFLRQLSLVL